MVLTLSSLMTAKPTTLRDTALAVEAFKIFHEFRKIDDLIVVNAKREGRPDRYARSSPLLKVSIEESQKKTFSSLPSCTEFVPKLRRV